MPLSNEQNSRPSSLPISATPQQRLSLDKVLALSFPFLVWYFAQSFNTQELWTTEGNEVALTVIAIALSLLAIFYALVKSKKVTGKTAFFLAEFWPVPIVLLGYLALRFFRIDAVTDMFGITIQDLTIIQLDILLFNQPLPFYLQSLVSPLMTFFMESAYLHFYYMLPIGSLMYLVWREQLTTFIRLRAAIIFAMISGWICYFFIPVVGPIEFIPEQFNVALIPTSQVVYNAVDSFRYAYDCFPSLHTAIPWLTVLICWQHYNLSLKLLALFMALSITTATLYLRYHYGIDVLAGLFWALMAWFITLPMSIKVRFIEAQ